VLGPEVDVFVRRVLKGGAGGGGEQKEQSEVRERESLSHTPRCYLSRRYPNRPVM
jgi:hypothetical protein